MKIQEALVELRKEKKRKFNQTVELIVNLRSIDTKRDNVNLVINLPHKVKDKKVCGFLTEKSKVVDTITESQFSRYTEKKELKNLVKHYDYFMAVAKLMPKVATNFGKVLGPAGKMPSPQLGLLVQENEAEIKKMIDKISTSLKIRLKEASLKIVVGKENMSDEEIIDNINAVYKTVENGLPKKKENVKDVMLKFTMSKSLKVEM
jgi:large subunit ribosomal protein L1